MSSRIETHIDCDHDGCIMSYRIPLGETLSEARAESDWLTIRTRTIRDYCLKHRRQHEHEARR